MIILAVMLVAVFAFLFGFFWGLCFEAKPKSKERKIKPEQEDTELMKEYENFLSYDGTAQ